ncbi:MAG TPA: hypothetical protein VNZ86_17350, partial [Bacteroidia bacterium]|jgi:hypothetical protein|nr:hypothetical protein [Bacteroidia bacterium]
MNLFRKPLAWLMIGLGFLLYTFFYTYQGHMIPYPALFYWLGFGLIVGGYAILRRSSRPGKEKAQQETRNKIAHLKSQGEQVTVLFDACVLKTNDYSEEVEKYAGSVFGSRIQYMNALYNEMDNVEVVDVYQTVLVFNRVKNGNTYEYHSPVIHKDPETLAFKLGLQKQTTLYIDRMDQSIYYFDLEFLDI